MILMIGITVYTGVQTYELSQSWGTSLHRQIREWRTQTHVDIAEVNVLDPQPLDGLFSLIDEEVNLPDELYLTNFLEMEFDRNGQITSFYASLHGENDEGVFEHFLISTGSEPNQLTVTEGAYPEPPETDEQMLLYPLIETLNQLTLEETIQEWPSEERFGLYYSGYRTWGYNDSGIYYIEDGEPVELAFPEDEIIGYTVSVYVSGKTEEITPKRFIDRSLSSPAETQIIEAESEPLLGYHVDEKQQEMYFITEELGYRLPVIDAATGSRWYGLEKTENGGETWDTVNENPFDGRSGVTSGIKFWDEDLGFMVLARGSQSEATLFRTENGGERVTPVEFPSVEVPLIDDETYNPFQFPEIPYEENGRLYVTVGQGAEGDYNAGTKALYQSEDDGETWEFMEEVD